MLPGGLTAPAGLQFPSSLLELVLLLRTRFSCTSDGSNTLWPEIIFSAGKGRSVNHPCDALALVGGLTVIALNV